MAELNRGRKVVSRVCGAATYVMDVKVPHSVEHRPKSTSMTVLVLLENREMATLTSGVGETFFSTVCTLRCPATRQIPICVLCVSTAKGGRLMCIQTTRSQFRGCTHERGRQKTRETTNVRCISQWVKKICTIYRSVQFHECVIWHARGPKYLIVSLWTLLSVNLSSTFWLLNKSHWNIFDFNSGDNIIDEVSDRLIILWVLAPQTRYRRDVSITLWEFVSSPKLCYRPII